MVHLLYDTAARIQDVAVLTVENFGLENWNGRSGIDIKFAAQKTSARDVFITASTLKLV